ncbi:class I adenylate-forming enzyme family protein [Janibacter anophelis]|uniref:class I adenylate-forming enzyme family protein n=1 Tax=Janibacter anophelis TaxID=319054 RepID=UPI000DF012CB|nr:class I adenylate-forming enzyme family protein [Janibacter anophelis]
MHLSMLLDMACDGFGERTLVGRARNGMTAADLRRRARVGAALLRDQGAEALVYLDVNGPAYPVAMFAAAYAGVPLVPVNYRLGEEQLDYLLGQHPGAMAVTSAESRAHAESIGLRPLTSQEWLEATDQDDDGSDAEWSEQPAIIIYTSGTTSRPKGVLLRHQNLVSYVFGSVEFAGASEDDAALVSVPPYHIAAVANVLSNLYAGRRTLVLEQFTPQEWLTVVREEAVTNALVVPTMLARIVSSEGDVSVPTLRNLAYGGAPMPTRVIERALTMWPEVGFVNAYGLTETSSTIAVLGPEDHRVALASDDPAVRARLGSTGQVLPTVELEIRDMDDQVSAPGEVGRICVRGDQVSAEYAGVGRAVDERGFFDTRDKGYVDEDGYLFIGGRVDDTIIRGGENIAPAEIETVLFDHEDVEDCAVVGVPDDEWGQRIEAAVVARPGRIVDPESLREYVRAHLRGSKTPDRIHIMDELPRTETGKLVRRHMVSAILDRLASVEG